MALQREIRMRPGNGDIARTEPRSISLKLPASVGDGVTLPVRGEIALERAGVRGRVRDGLVGLIEVENGDVSNMRAFGAMMIRR